MASILHKNLVNITIANTLRHFGGALVEVFVPLLLIQHGFSLLSVCGFYLVYAIVKLAINYQAMRVANHYGARIALILARISYIAYLLCLVTIVAGKPIDIAWLMACMLNHPHFASGGSRTAVVCG